VKKPDYSLFLKCLLGSFLLAPAITQAQETVEETGISLETCELVVPGTPLSAMAECGWLEVAENPAEPEGRKISIRVARVPATGRTSEPDPLIFFAGGPGQAATETWPIVAGGLRKLNETRDILLIDQRGTGQSNPLRCPEVELDEILAFDWHRPPASVSNRWTVTRVFTRQRSQCRISTRSVPHWVTKASTCLACPTAPAPHRST
jgi:hypothetical protein